ncbi:hypothetical protein Q5H92_05485 [Hymenobacter sp. M29]|uniref:Uncharacterized protein n=1 Tax=Hymenobacter mellowenesis TaxID=3063995 RepID=A0ABT9A7H3_9BACT|nr:hypothetical protein [Hymenobacter sp. M29]MDO7845800.1 hypothetical protein [Hymenobacter sp. M29]
MPFDPTTFPIDDTQLPWGLSLAEVEARLPGRAWWEPYGGWPNLRGACHTVFGLAATACNVRAQARHKPVLQVSYELAPPPTHRGERAVPPATWMQSLTQLLGPPTEAKTYPNANHPGNVKYSARWEQWPLQVSLSVYGGVRLDEPGGPAAAGLFLDWQDMVAVAGPLVAAAQAQANALAAVAGQVSQLERFDTAQTYTPFYVPDSSSPGPQTPYTNDQRRQAERALYRDGLCDTPALLARQLTEQQALLWAVPGQESWAVSTRRDTVLVPVDAPPLLELVTLHPARGSGYISLYVGAIHLQDAYGSPTLGRMADALERATGAPVSRVEEYDC